MLRLSSLVLVLSVSIAAAQPQGATPATPNPLGWTWVCPPSPLDSLPFARASGEITFSLARLGDGSLFATVSRAGGMELTGPRTEYRLVAIDATSARHDIRQRGSSGSQAMMVMSFLIPASPAPTQIGVEVLRPEGRRLVAEDALRKANERGVEILPMPEVGKPLAFALTDLDDREIRSQDLRGKLVLIDFWATWCGPCMAKMPKLKALYEEWHAKGLEIVGVSYDRTREDCIATAAKEKLPWSLVHVPEEEGVRELWEAATGVNTLPRLFLLDRDGIVREDFYPLDIAATLEPYLTKQ